jgi:N-acetylneuraminate synthase
MIEPIDIGGRKIGPGQPCFIIAEAGVNHNGSLPAALDLVDVAAAAGADAVKFQLYRAAEQVSQDAPTAGYQTNGTGAENMLAMAQSYDLPWEHHRQIAAHCRTKRIMYMSSCFDTAAVDLLISLGGACIKIGSGEITNYPLLAYCTATGKPILLSTGMSTFADVEGAVEVIRANGHSPLALFQCTSSYPADPSAANLRAMQTMSERFDVPVGYSDHTLGKNVSIAAVALGATMIEKHFTLSKALPGPDHKMSLEPEELRQFVAGIREAETALGQSEKKPDQSELEMLKVARRGLVSAHAIRVGDLLSDADVTLKRPATGIDPRLWPSIRGRKVAVDIPADVPITWDMLE